MCTNIATWNETATNMIEEAEKCFTWWWSDSNRGPLAWGTNALLATSEPPPYPWNYYNLDLKQVLRVYLMEDNFSHSYQKPSVPLDPANGCKIPSLRAFLIRILTIFYRN